MDGEQYRKVIAAMVDMIDREAKNATTAAEVEALAAAVQALSSFTNV